MSRPLASVRPSSCGGRYEEGEEAEEREDDAPMSAVELFAGAGGASLGLARAGVRSLVRVEWDADAAATLRRANSLDRVIEGDVREVDWRPYAGRCDLLWASPPCQAFSSAGKRLGEADARNGWPWTLDAIDAIDPTWTICENVPGLLHHRGDCKPRDGTTKGCAGCYWIGTVLPAFRERFDVVEVRVLDAADYGTPQHRKRVFLVAGPRAIRWPEPTHGPGMFTRPWVSIGEALGVVGFDAVAYRRGREGGAVYETHPMDEPACALRASAGGSSQPFLFREDPRHPVNELDAPGTALRSGGDGHTAPPYYVRTECLGASSTPSSEPAPTIGTKMNTYLHADDPGRREAGDIITTSRTGRRRIEYPLAAPTQSRGPSDAVRRHPIESLNLPASTMGAMRPMYVEGILSQPAPCLTIGDHASSRNVISASAKTRAEYDRAGIERLTVEQCATLQGFPAGYPWQGTKTAQYRQVGNAVVPRVAELLALAVMGW